MKKVFLCLVLIFVLSVGGIKAEEEALIENYVSLCGEPILECDDSVEGGLSQLFDVHQVVYDKAQIIRFDILAYVTGDANTLTIKNTLTDSFEFVSTADEVKVLDFGVENNHLIDGTIISDKTKTKNNPIISGAESIIDDQTLTIVIPTKGLAKHYVRVVFLAKLKEDIVMDYMNYESITENAPVLSDKEHSGFPNQASYSIMVNNQVGYEDTSNIVTVEYIPVIRPEDPAPSEDSDQGDDSNNENVSTSDNKNQDKNSNADKENSLTVKVPATLATASVILSVVGVGTIVGSGVTIYNFTKSRKDSNHKND